MSDPGLDPGRDSVKRDSGQRDSADRDSGWSISFAGCGFMGVYYIGAAACLLQRCPELVHRATRLYGSSAGALLAAILSVGIPLDQVCTELMSLVHGARAHRLGPLHPDFNLMQHVQNFLLRALPADAHEQATGRLFLSVTRVSDGKNQLLSEFSSKEELIQALICSCFVPFYCGVFPPKYRGVRYVDGAVSDNLPRCDQKKTITISPYAGESDVCPRPQGQMYMRQILFNNMSIEVNPENLYRVTSTFFPPEPKVLAEVCQNGFVDALRFLQENGLVNGDAPVQPSEPREPCCEWEHVFQPDDQSDEGEIQTSQSEPARDAADQSERTKLKPHLWLDPRLTEKLPPEIRKVLCESCRSSPPPSSGFLSQVKSFLRLPKPRPLRSPWTMAHRLVEWLPDTPTDLSWLYSVFSPIWREEQEEQELMISEVPPRRCKSLPSGLDLFDCGEDAQPDSKNVQLNMNENIHENIHENTQSDAAKPQTEPQTEPQTKPADFTWDQSDAFLPLTPPLTPVLSPAPSPGASWGFGLGRAVDWIRTIRSTASPTGDREHCNK